MKQLIADIVAKMFESLAKTIRTPENEIEIVLDHICPADSPDGRDVWRIQLTTPRDLLRPKPN